MNIYNEIIENKKKIAEEIIELCNKYDIHIVMPLAKKGKLMLDLLGIKTKIEKNKIQVISDRELNKQGNYEDFNGNILLFDDSIKTGARLKHTKTYLEKKIFDKILSESNKINYKVDFFYYTLVKCGDIKLLDDFEEDKLTCFKENNVTISDYYSFCIRETYDFQKNLFSTSMDLPLFSLKVESIDQLRKDLIGNGALQFKDAYSNIANKKISLGVLLVNIPDFLESLKGFAIASTAKIRYEKQTDGVYKVIYNPFVICESIKYDELENLYNILFKENIHLESKFDMNLQFVKMYRKVIYFLSFIIGFYIKDYLERHDYDVNFVNNYDINIEGIIQNYSFIDLCARVEWDLKHFNYTGVYNMDPSVIEKNFEDTRIYTEQQTLIDLYDTITEERSNNKLNDYNYNFIEMKELSHLYKKDNIMNFVTSMYKLIENYTISQEIEFNFANSIVERGFVNGENGDVNLPVENPEVFIQGIINFYEHICKSRKSSDVYNTFKENYDLFIDKFYNIQNIDGLFDNELVSYETFKYLTDYFKKISEKDFVRKIKGKEVYLENEDNKTLVDYVNNKMDSILLSSDFTYNR